MKTYGLLIAVILATAMNASAAPTITVQPVSRTVNVGTSVSFAVTANTPDPPLSYQWRKDGVDIPAGTDATYTIVVVLESDAGSYACVVSDTLGSTPSNTATLTVTVPPVFTTWYVDASNPTPGDGTTWLLAFPTISAAINGAESGDEIWVAGGTYFEAIGITDNLSLYGGFAGAYHGLPGETLREERNPSVNETVIDGSFARGGLPAYHVVIGRSNVVLDGFTIAGGVANGGAQHNNGAGMVNSDVAEVVVANCKFTGNTAGGFGGAMYNENASVQVTGCTFTGNVALQGGGVYNQNGLLTLNRCNFMVNRATVHGGAVVLTSDQTALTQTIDACAFSRNEAAGYGGAVYVFNGHPIFYNAVFRANVADFGAALMNQSLDTIILLWNCTFLDNGPRLAAVINNELSAFNLTNCIMWDPEATEEVHSTGSITVAFSDIRVTGPDPFPGPGNINADPQFVRQFFSMTKPGGDLSLKQLSPCLNTGTSSGAPGTDILGEPRPVGLPVDMGAHQHALQPFSLDLPPIMLVNADEFPVSGFAPPGSLVLVTGGEEMYPDGLPRRPVYQQLGALESQFNVSVPLRQNGVNLLTVTFMRQEGTVAAPVYCTIIEGDAFPQPPKGGVPKSLSNLQIVPLSPPYDDEGNVVFRCNAYYDGDLTPYDVTDYATWDAEDGNINHEGGRYVPGGTQTLITASFGDLQASFPYMPKQDDPDKINRAVMSKVTNRYLGTALTGCSVKPGATYTLTDCGAGNYSKSIPESQYTVSASKSGFLSASAPGQSNVARTLKVNFALWPNNPSNPGVSTWSPGKDSYYTVNTDLVTLIGSALGLDSCLKDVTITVTDPYGHAGPPSRILNALSPSLTFEPYRLAPFLASQYPNGFYHMYVPLIAGPSSVPYKIEINATNAGGGSASHIVWVLYTTEPPPPFGFSSVTGGGWHMEGSALVLEVVVQGATGELTYQWSKDGVDIPDATDDVYTLDTPTAADSGTYRCTAMDESKAIIFTDLVVVIVPPGHLPVAGLLGLAALAAALLGGGTTIVRRSVQSKKSGYM